VLIGVKLLSLPGCVDGEKERMRFAAGLSCFDIFIKIPLEEIFLIYDNHIVRNVNFVRFPIIISDGDGR